MPAKRKEIVYRGGVIRFYLPAHWIEHYEPDGGGTFYDPAEGSGTLRLNVITLRAPNRVTSETMSGLLRGICHERASNAIVRDLPDGRALLTYTKHTSEDGQPIVLQYWELGAPVSPVHGRLAVFSYTALADQFESRAVQDMLADLERAIEQAAFGPELGG